MPQGHPHALFIAARTYSSWSLRGWLMFETFDLPVKTHMVDLYGGDLQAELAGHGLAPARLVPVLRSPEGHVLGETLAMAEHLAAYFPEASLWPADPGARMAARWLVSEMHAGFAALRSACPMQLLCQYQGFEVSDAVAADLARLDQLFAYAETQRSAEGPWIFGDWSLADCFYAPVAMRIAGYGLPVSPRLAAYTRAMLAHPAIRRWRALALTETFAQDPYAKDLPRGAWPGPAPLPARAVSQGTPVNAACPFSGQPVTDLAEIDGTTVGFCNATCRDKTVNDAEAWPAVMALLDR
ncbi:MAG: glutathione S-transferase [Rhodobacteraceae bacterium]|nr:glutathione S-transferase [Paracoccaceae bacterium]MBR9819947.1 glutathione S-transferase [Paracoccaceae bacterium]